jgi:hypothetical protein
MKMKSYMIPRSISFPVMSGLVALSFFHYASILPVGKIIIILGFVACPFRLITGIPCPGCGMTHSLLSIVQGNIWDAACYNPFSFFLVFLLGISLFPDAYLKRQPQRVVNLMKLFFIIVLCSALSYWLLFKVFRLS